MILASRQLLKEVSARKRKSTVIQWLCEQRIAFLPGADGWPKVDVRELERLLLTGAHEARQSRHNFAALAEPQART